jgi:hypothetical protein
VFYATILLYTEITKEESKKRKISEGDAYECERTGFSLQSNRANDKAGRLQQKAGASK